MDYNFSKNQKINQTLNLVVTNLSQMAEEQLNHINQLTKIGKSLSSETDLDRIFDLILDEGISFTNADAATIYMVSDDAQALEFELVYNASMNKRDGGSRGPVGWPAIKLFNEDGSPKLSHIVTSVYHRKETLAFDDVYETKDYDITGTLNTDKTYGYRCKSMITIPLMNHEEEVLGVMQFINAMDEDRQIISFTEEHVTMLQSLASQAAIALSNRKLIENLENLLMEFIRSIAVAIERKSKYSSDHIMRVAKLTEMLAERIHNAESGHFAETRFTPNELKEISMAGWMHDMGKIITPEFVMDKSRKLERIMDGIQVVQERFARLALLIKYLRTQLSAEELTAFIHEHISSAADSSTIDSFLEEARCFIENLNVGDEFVPKEKIERMEALAGIDFEYEGCHFFLLDELDRKNLSIQRGTLNSEELKVMRAHVSITWEMLSQLSFPKKYKNVAFYASTHHEALNGSGYPKGLDAPQLPLQSRMIAVVDIFEALTAADRPYKTPKTLSEAFGIMANMAKGGHLDKDLVDFFMDSGLYLDFARANMLPEQIDEVDIPLIKSRYHFA